MPSLEAAIDYARNLPRYRRQTLTQKHRGGFFVPQVCIPFTTRAAYNKAAKIAKAASKDERCSKILWVEAKKIRSEQISLRRDKLIRHLKQYAAIQRKRRPVIIMIGRSPLLWDGNHRVTSALLLGKKFIRCEVFFEIRA